MDRFEIYFGNRTNGTFWCVGMGSREVRGREESQMNSRFLTGPELLKVWSFDFWGW